MTNKKKPNKVASGRSRGTTAGSTGGAASATRTKNETQEPSDRTGGSSAPTAVADLSGDAETAARRTDPGRGREADKPTDIPAKGWKDIFARVRAEAKDDHVPLLSAGVAFYALLSMVPGLVALISIYGLVADPDKIGTQVVDSLAAAPKEVRELVTSQLTSVASSSSGSAALAAILGILLALWSASAGVGHLIDALNVAYDEKETRNFLRRKGLALAFTIGATLFLVLAFALVALLPAVLADTGLGFAGRLLANLARWVILLGGMMVGLAILYRYAPDRDEPRWRWTSPGALAAATLWIFGSIIFSIYTANFGKYNETYGSLGVVVVVMLWLFLTAVSVMLGAELNAELERQTAKDTTKGTTKPLGRRGAYAADTVGETAQEVAAAKRER